MKGTYAIGIDYGTESGRALIVDTRDGRVLASHVTPYPHGVMDKELPEGGVKLGTDWALQHPDDYVEVLRRSVPEALRLSGVSADEVIGVGIDFTACTILPIDERNVPLCFQDAWKHRPHAWVKLWKHHAAQEDADRLNELAEARGETFLSRYGGSLSSEWMLPKVAQTLREDPDVYAAADRFVEAADWLVWEMTGTLKRNSCAAGYKGTWHKTEGFPAPDYLKAADPRLERLAETKLRGEVVASGTKAGELTAEMARLTGLKPGTPVAAAIIDAHAAVPGVGVVAPGTMVLAMGTSLCHMLIADTEQPVEGIRGVVEDGIVPGYFGYEAGQPAVGDLFAWFVEQGVPAYVRDAAAREGISVFDWLGRAAEALAPGESGLLALDWWNGNRSVLADESLSGLIVGLKLHTKPEEIYRALLEATAFGTKRVIEAFEKSGIPVDVVAANGGIPQRNPLLMQIYADVTGKPIDIPAAEQSTALGSAMMGAVAAGSAGGGFDSLAEAAARMAPPVKRTYKPNPDHVRIYEELYAEYLVLHDFFGRSANGVMHNLRKLKERAKSAVVAERTQA
ncbi:ribulokinase [Paenibacillus hemerocallicola]|uniref:Ribulokinase n=1 Tax=Paenibacillus hemerocallicola TaxID=1172614 RepID=A0A5C4T8S9_9BACL|nr:ribulokinase [Paenibacillus hemerocallicola]TNJ65431.1 ribulokinase [Paenibacillus hemerocallicola]